MKYLVPSQRYTRFPATTFIPALYHKIYVTSTLITVQPVEIKKKFRSTRTLKEADLTVYICAADARPKKSEKLGSWGGREKIGRGSVRWACGIRGDTNELNVIRKRTEDKGSGEKVIAMKRERK